ncbi:leucine-rich repeat-containing protein 9 [Planoprotostelium fungivorum]|uniref:Leucine-rich repeat-containing protein 9 n=1 Tax=Planoprotostelium fungivorum TaxID=1890364 RepID=A0A2P6N341_9EUKA|nr:leucine-rich repeat-containing protein 9 [Planoprotostelium fungivorum]PRP78386.1 leucine-rich repeat-containing protein 9 [Planoprotostelium fungivorum]
MSDPHSPDLSADDRPIELEEEEEYVEVVPIVLSTAVCKEVYAEHYEEDDECTELEFVFDLFSEIEDLSAFRYLRKLILVGNGLTVVPPSLGGLASSLQILYLCQQSITKIENLSKLTELRELYMYNNTIQKMEGLHSCQKLQRLWLYSNQITDVDGLSSLKDLRELWIQDNQITALPEKEGWICSRIEMLCFSGNPIQEMKSTARSLLHLSNLSDLSFDDDIFPPCPVVSQEGYRTFMIFHLKQIHILDATLVRQEEVERIAELYNSDMAAFINQLDELKRDSKEQIKNIQYKRKSLEEKAVETKKQLMESFAGLEMSIEEARNKVTQSRTDQGNDIFQMLQRYSTESEARWSRRKELEKNITAAVKRHSLDTDKWIEAETIKQKSEERHFTQLRQLTRDHRRRQLSLLLSHYSPKSQQICYRLDRGHPEFVKSHFAESTPRPAENGKPHIHKIHQIYKIFTTKSQLAFEKSLKKLGAASPKLQRLYSLSDPQLSEGGPNGILGKDHPFGDNLPAFFTEDIPEFNQSNRKAQSAVLAQVILARMGVLKANFTFPLDASMLKEMSESNYCLCVENDLGKRVYIVFNEPLYLSEYTIFYSVNSHLQKNHLQKYLDMFLSEVNQMNQTKRVPTTNRMHCYHRLIPQMYS